MIERLHGKVAPSFFTFVRETDIAVIHFVEAILMKVNFLLTVAFLTLTCPLGAHDALAPSVLSLTNFVEFVKKNINRRVVLNVTGNLCDFLDFVRLLMDVVFLAPYFACIPSTKLLFWEQVQLRSSSKETAWVLLLVTLPKGKFTNGNPKAHSNGLFPVLDDVF